MEFEKFDFNQEFETLTVNHGQKLPTIRDIVVNTNPVYIYCLDELSNSAIKDLIDGEDEKFLAKIEEAKLRGWQTYWFNVVYHPRGDAMHAFYEVLGPFRVRMWEEDVDTARKLVTGVFNTMSNKPASALAGAVLARVTEACLERIREARQRAAETCQGDEGFWPGSTEEKLERMKEREEYREFFVELEHFQHIQALVKKHGKIPQHRSIDDE